MAPDSSGAEGSPPERHRLGRCQGGPAGEKSTIRRAKVSDKVTTNGPKGIAMSRAAETASAGTATNGAARPKTLSERADELEEQMLKQLDKVPSKSPLYASGDIDPRVGIVPPPLQP